VRVAVNNIATIISKAGSDFKQSPWNRYNEDGSLTLTNPTIKDLSDFLAHYAKLVSASREFEHHVSNKYNVLSKGPDGPVWSYNPDSEIMTISGYDDIPEALAKALPEYMLKYNITFTADSKITTFHSLTPERKKKMLDEFMIELEKNLLFGAPDCEGKEAADLLKEAVSQKRGNPSSLSTFAIIWAEKVIGINKIEHVTGITVQQQSKVVMPFEAVRIDEPEPHLYLTTAKMLSPELKQMIAESHSLEQVVDR
jgi:hypothetical protein